MPGQKQIDHRLRASSQAGAGSGGLTDPPQIKANGLRAGAEVKARFLSLTDSPANKSKQNHTWLYSSLVISFKYIRASASFGFSRFPGQGVLSSSFAQQSAPADWLKRRLFVPFRYRSIVAQTPATLVSR